MQSLQKLFRRGDSGNPLTRIFSLLISAVMVGGLLVGAQSASAQSGPTVTGEICMQKVFGTPVSNSNRLNCTANDIRLSKAINVLPDTCIAGSTFDLTATFETVVTANARYDAGFFFRIDGGANARGDDTGATGQCSLSALTPGVNPSLNLDGDTCGDLNSGTYEVTFTIPGVLCNDSDGDGFLNLPNCTSWHSNQGTACSITGTPPDAPVPSTFQPDTKSKCVCDDTFQVPVIVETATLTVVKTAAPTSVPETGKTVTYSVSVTNKAQFVSVTITDVTDDIYGNLGTNTPAYDNNTCPDLIGAVLAPGGSASCSFDAFVSGDFGDTITDVAEVCGDDDAGHTDICDDDDASVTITDVAATPSLTKTATATANCQLDATYGVTVSNNSAIDTLTVNTLTDDKFGDITTAHAAGGGFEQVVSTTCAKGGIIAPLGNYSCSFVGRITSALCTFSHVDQVTGNVTDDDGVNSTPSDTATVSVTTTTP
ncbi:MAG: hypothetical protein AB7G75_02365 [Candidatus Binatia bacterium]